MALSSVDQQMKARNRAVQVLLQLLLALAHVAMLLDVRHTSRDAGMNFPSFTQCGIATCGILHPAASGPERGAPADSLARHLSFCPAGEISSDLATRCY